MSTTTQTIAEWLLGCIAEDEANAGQQHDTGCDFIRNGLRDPAFGWECDCGVPAHVLAVCAAHRKIVKMHSAQHVCAPADENDMDSEPYFEALGRAPAWVPPCPTIRALALAYADRPGFQESWRP